MHKSLIKNNNEKQIEIDALFRIHLTLLELLTISLTFLFSLLVHSRINLSKKTWPPHFHFTPNNLTPQYHRLRLLLTSSLLLLTKMKTKKKLLIFQLQEVPLLFAFAPFPVHQLSSSFLFAPSSA